MEPGEEHDPRDADVVDPAEVPEAVKPSTTGTVATGNDEGDEDDGPS